VSAAMLTVQSTETSEADWETGISNAVPEGIRP
jgi:hypothetical protein